MNKNRLAQYVYGVFSAVVLVLIVCTNPSMGFAQGPTPDKPIVWRYGTYNPEMAINSQNAIWFMEEVTKRTGGKIKFRAFWGGSLFKAGEELEAVRTRVADIGTVALGNYPAQLPLAQLPLVVIPWGPENEGILAAALRTCYDTMPALPREFEKYNMKRLYAVGSGSYELNLVKPIKTVEEMKGLKIAVIGKWMSKYLPPVAAAPIMMPASERPLALKTGVLNGQIFPLEYVYTYKHYEAAPYVILANFGASVWAQMCLNMDAWKELSPDLQKTVLDVAKEAEQELARRIDKTIQESAEGIRKGKGDVLEFPMAEKQKWVNAMPNLPVEWAEEMKGLGLPGFDFIKRYMAACEAAGYKFPRDWMKGY